jgi:hypothetical protein
VGVGRARENRCLERLQRASPERGTWHRAKRTECPRTRWPRRTSSLPHGGLLLPCQRDRGSIRVLRCSIGAGEGGGSAARVLWSGAVARCGDCNILSFDLNSKW